MLTLPGAACERVWGLMRFRSFKQQQELFSLVEKSVLCFWEGTLSCWSSPSLASWGCCAGRMLPSGTWTREG